MTVDERKEQRVRVRMDLEDAQAELSALRVKAERMAEALDDVVAKIRHNVGLEPTGRDFSPEYDLQNRLSPQNQADLSYDALVRVIEELKIARQKVFNRDKQDKQLAASAGWTVAS